MRLKLILIMAITFFNTHTLIDVTTIKTIQECQFPQRRLQMIKQIARSMRLKKEIARKKEAAQARERLALVATTGIDLAISFLSACVVEYVRTQGCQLWAQKIVPVGASENFYEPYMQGAVRIMLEFVSVYALDSWSNQKFTTKGLTQSAYKTVEFAGYTYGGPVAAHVAEDIVNGLKICRPITVNPVLVQYGLYAFYRTYRANCAKS